MPPSQAKTQQPTTGVADVFQSDTGSCDPTYDEKEESQATKNVEGQRDEVQATSAPEETSKAVIAMDERDIHSSNDFKTLDQGT